MFLRFVYKNITVPKKMNLVIVGIKAKITEKFI